MAKKKPFLSIIIPVYNAGWKLPTLLKSVFSSAYRDFEVIAVDDASTDNSIELAKAFDVKIVRLEKNSGAAAARNIGAKEARADVLVFLDDDVVLKKDALEKIAEAFRDKEIHCLAGVYAKEPADGSLFGRYRALLEFFWMKDAGTIDGFVPAIGAVRKKLFREVGGFNENYGQLEEVVFGYEINKRHPIILRADIQAFHHFPTFKRCVKLYFKRCFVWVRLFLKMQRFGKVAMTPSTGFAALLALSIVFFSLLCLFFSQLAFVPPAFFLLFLAVNAKMYWFVFGEAGPFFLLYFFATNFILQAIVGTAAVFSLLTVPFLGIEWGWA
ncbi:MAG: glycosyltransferase family 2 protein [Candidatus Diapherotrites archaeon]